MKYLLPFLLLGCQMQPLKVTTMNIANGADDDKFRSQDNRAEQAKFLKSLNADIIGMQEVDLMVKRSGYTNTGLNALGYNNYLLGLILEDNETYVFEVDGGTYVFGPSLTFNSDFCDDLNGECDNTGNAKYGNALFFSDRLTVMTATTIPYTNTIDKEHRSMLLVRAILEDGQIVNVINTHLTGNNSDDRAKQLQQIRELVEPNVANTSIDGHFIVMGDFNCLNYEANTFIGKHLNNTGYSKKTDGMIYDSIDQIWYSNKLELIETTVQTTTSTDHGLAITATLK